VNDPSAESTRPPLHPDSIAVRAGRAANGSSLSSPLWSSTVWASETVDAARRSASGTRAEKFYARYANPTVNAFEDAVAAMEGAEAALAFGSGMGAIASVVMALCSPGDHIVAQQHLYSGTQIFLQAVCSRFGIEVTFVDGHAPGAFAAAVQPGRTMMVFAETPANPQLSLVDLDELGAIVGPITVVDSTLATPYLQQPHRHGVDLVIHSATKGICGHNDATLGVVSGEADVVADIWRYAVLHGAVASPFDALNALRGLRTLPVRIERQSATARRLTCMLDGHRAVEAVHYPGLPSHPQYDLAKRQMRDTGSIFSFVLRGGADAARRFAERLTLAQLATSLGGPETLVTVPALSTHIGLSPDEKDAAGICDGLVRVSVGLEHADDLVADFIGALDAG
jgi:cystathionine beta-lyase/cystathionine gamma-synthase